MPFSSSSSRLPPPPPSPSPSSRRVTPPRLLIAVIGATGTGKSKLAVHLARHYYFFPSSSMILNADAMQMYRGLPILTNKPTWTERRGIKHHMLDFVGLDEETWRVGRFVKKAEDVIAQNGLSEGEEEEEKEEEEGEKEEEKRKRMGGGEDDVVVVVVGGTHYYVQGLLFGPGGDGGMLLGEERDDDEVDEVVELLNTGVERKKIGEEEEKEEKEKGGGDLSVLEGTTEDMRERLKAVDPVMARRWHPRDRRKIRRSLEIWMKTGRRASEIYKEQNATNKRKSTSKGNNGQLVDDDGGGGGGGNLAEGAGALKYPTLIFWLYSDMAVLKKRLDDRVDEMVRKGLLEEVEEMDEYLHRKTQAGVAVDQTRGVWVSIGFKEFKPYLAAKRTGISNDAGLEKLKQESIERVKIATRQYAKRQERWIRIKLWKALQNAQATDRLIVLDVTDPSQWQAQVGEASRRIVDKFLKGEDLPNPRSLSKIADQVLGQVSNQVEEDKFDCKECEVCNKILPTSKQWDMHLTSKGHRKRVRYASKYASATQMARHTSIREAG